MAKRRGRPPTKKSETEHQKAKPSEERASFLPDGGESEPEQAQELQKKDASIEAPEIADIPDLSVRVYEKEPKRFWAEVTAKPVEPSEWPIASLDSKISPERRASLVLGAIAQAASAGAQRGLIQEVKRRDEEAAAKERFAKRA